MSVLFEKQSAHAVIRMDHLENLNALSPELLLGIDHALDLATQDPDIRVILLTGSGRAFSAGADIRFMANAQLDECRGYLENAQAVLERIESLKQPVIAVVNGVCTGGGCALAGACELTIAADSATFGEPEARIGLPGGFGNISRLVRRVGNSVATELLLTGKIIDAHTAHKIGLVWRVVPAAELWNEAGRVAEEMAGNSPTALANIKAILRSKQDSNVAEITAYLTCLSTGEGREGMIAFLEKREPNW